MWSPGTHSGKELLCALHETGMPCKRKESKFGFMENIWNLNQTVVLNKKCLLKHQQGENEIVLCFQALFATSVGIPYHKIEMQQ